MKFLTLTYIVLLVAVVSYTGSYYLCVSEVHFGFIRGREVAVAPAYRYFPRWIDAVALYRPVHMLDRTYLRRARWETRPAKPGALSGEIVGTRRLLFAVPYTNAP